MSTLKIGTHDGRFHCDEALACFMIKKLPQFKNATIVRSRDINLLNNCDIVVDVGGVYDPEKLRFDHHQKEFDVSIKTILPDSQCKALKLSSAGLIYAHYGKEIIADYNNWDKNDQKTNLVFDIVYNCFINEIDAIDNGLEMYPGKEPLYRIHTHLSQRVNNLNPEWNEESNDVIMYEKFSKAVELAGNEFMENVHYYSKSWLPVRELVMKAFQNRFEHDPDGRIVVLERPLPWLKHLFQIEKENDAVGSVLFVIFKEEAFRIRSVPVTESSFELRKGLNKSWRGLPADEISKISNIHGCIFVHSTGFIGGNKTFEGAIQMAKKSMD